MIKHTNECQPAKNPEIRIELNKIENEIGKLEESTRLLNEMLQFISREEVAEDRLDDTKESRLSCEMAQLLHGFMNRIKEIGAKISYRISVLEI